jgi:hypothetical protein
MLGMLNFHGIDDFVLLNFVKFLCYLGLLKPHCDEDFLVFTKEIFNKLAKFHVRNTKFMTACLNISVKLQ